MAYASFACLEDFRMNLLLHLAFTALQGNIVLRLVPLNVLHAKLEDLLIQLVEHHAYNVHLEHLHLLLVLLNALYVYQELLQVLLEDSAESARLEKYHLSHLLRSAQNALLPNILL
jgi:hypothetical protein